MGTCFHPICSAAHMSLSKGSGNHPHPPLPHPSEHLIRQHPHSASPVTLILPIMPDIIPIVRRPVRRVNPQTSSDKSEVTSGQHRKLSIGGESNTTQVSPVKVRRAWVPPKDRSPMKEKKTVRSCDEPLPPPPKTPTYNIPEFLSSTAFPAPRSDNTPALPVAKSRVAKTNVSQFSLHIV